MDLLTNIVSDTFISVLFAFTELPSLQLLLYEIKASTEKQRKIGFPSEKGCRPPCIAMTFSTMTVSIITFSMASFSLTTVRITNGMSIIMKIMIIMFFSFRLSFIYAECRYAGCRDAGISCYPLHSSMQDSVQYGQHSKPSHLASKNSVVPCAASGVPKKLQIWKLTGNLAQVLDSNPRSPDEWLSARPLCLCCQFSLNFIF
jgi:hypothetical protein